MFAVVDCNNFFASCERVFNPKLHNRPVVVLSNNDGCIIARSNEAKALGIKMGEPAFQIREILKKNNVAVFSTNYTLYGDMSERVMNIISSYAPDVEIYSIDEAFLDLWPLKYHDLQEFALELRKRILRWTGLPVSIGIASTKTLAKVANRIAKKYPGYKGVFMFTQESQVHKALNVLDVEDIWGVGRQYSKMLKRNGIYTALQLTQQSDVWIKKHMTVMGLRTVKELRGESCIPMEFVRPDKQGILTSRSFGKEAVSTFTTRCAEKLRRQNSVCNLLTVFIRTDRFKPEDPQYKGYKVINLPVPTNNILEMVKFSMKGLELIYRKDYRYKKAGVFVTGIVPDSQVQTNLFDEVDRQKNEDAIQAVESINQRLGRDKVRLATQGFDREWRLRQEQLSGNYTTNWDELLLIKI
jgi:DNA polymerase V